MREFSLSRSRLIFDENLTESDGSDLYLRKNIRKTVDWTLPILILLSNILPRFYLIRQPPPIYNPPFLQLHMSQFNYSEER